MQVTGALYTGTENFTTIKFPLNVYQLMDWEMFIKGTGLKENWKVICLYVKCLLIMHLAYKHQKVSKSGYKYLSNIDYILMSNLKPCSGR